MICIQDFPPARPPRGATTPGRMMDKIQCPHCKANGIPHLWHYQPSMALFRFAKTQHICRLCGQVMYETGGQMNVLGYLALFMGSGVVLQILNLGWRNEWWWQILSNVLSGLLLAFFGYKIVRYFINVFRSFINLFR